MPITRTFKSGKSQAVRIPAELAYDRSVIEVGIDRQGDAIRIRPVCRSLAGVLKKFAAHPTSASAVFADIESLIKALGGTIEEREGSRVRIELKGEQWRCHRPHPGKEAKRYQVEEARERLERTGMLP